MNLFFFFFFEIINDTNIPIWFVTLHIKASRKFYSTKNLHPLVKEFFKLKRNESKYIINISIVFI